MNEINLDPSRRPLSPLPAAKAAAPKPPNLDPDDSVHLSSVPDLSQVEKKLETDFARLRSRLEEQVNSPDYPSGETMDRLARILARGLSAPGSLE